MTTWLIHRITGLFMIVLFGIKFSTAFFLLREDKPQQAIFLHRHPVIDITLIFLFCLHSCFGLKTILYELGFRREKLLVRLATAVALILSVVGTVIYLRTA